MELAEEERALKGALEHRPEDGDMLVRLTSVLLEQGKAVPLDLEERALYHLIRTPGDHRRHAFRWCAVRLQQKKPVSREMLDVAFPDYPGPAEIYLFLNEAYTAATASGDADQLELSTRYLYDRFPDCEVSLYFRASWLYDFGDLKEGFELVDRRKDLAFAHDYLARLYATLLWRVGRRQASKAFIYKFFEGYSGDMWRTPDFIRQQALAIGRGIPPVLIVTLPKSGSLFMLNTLREGLSVPYCGLSAIGLFHNLIPSRVRDFARGGAVAVEHCPPTAQSLDLLYDSGIRKFVFHYRDIRQSSLSFVHHNVSDEIYYFPRAELLKRREQLFRQPRMFENAYRKLLSEWLTYLDRWLEFIEQDRRFQVLITDFDRMTSDEHGMLMDILDFYSIDRAQFDPSVLASSKETRAGHFRKGDREEWRDVLSDDLKAEITGTIAAFPRVQRLLPQWE